MGRKPCCAKEGMNKGTWTVIEDKILTDFINENGEGKWRNIPKLAGLKRCGKSCRLRWLNYLRPGIKRGNISTDEEDLILRLHKLLGNRWSLIAGRLSGRTDNEIKNYWNTNLSKRIQKQQSNKPGDEKKTTIKSTPNVNLPSASKCNTIMATPQQGMAQGKICDTNVAKILPAMNPIMVSESSRESSLLGFKSDSFSDFSMDFDMGEKRCFSDILGSNYTENVIQNDGCINNVCYSNNNNPSLFLDQSVFISEKMMEIWRGNEYARVNEESDFWALESFFESTEEWLGIDQYSV